MTRYVLLTKTKWDEPPRLRHQVARLLADAGHEVVFFEKAVPFWRRAPAVRTVHERITLVGCRELLHHKLRLAPFLHRLNARVALRSLHTGLRAIGASDPAVVVNFNYEYYFAGDVVSGGRVVTVINDDHTGSAIFGWRSPLDWALAKTCAGSDKVLTVSRVLADKLHRFCEPILFRPWADRSYVRPPERPRDTLLYWGYVNHRVNFRLLVQIAHTVPEYRLLIVGPVKGIIRRTLNEMDRLPNVEFARPHRLDDLPLDRVFAGILPYRDDVPSVRAADLPNKSLQLLARGLPLIVSGMPHFVSQPFVFQLDGDEPAAVVRRAARAFSDVQLAIGAFVTSNSARARLTQFMEIVHG